MKIESVFHFDCFFTTRERRQESLCASVCIVSNNEMLVWQCFQHLWQVGIMVSNPIIGTPRSSCRKADESAAAVTHCLDIDAAVAAVATETGGDMSCLIV